MVIIAIKIIPNFDFSLAKSCLLWNGTGMLERIRNAIRQERYRISGHANEEMAADDLLIADIEQIILTGRITRRFTRDPRGTRYEIHGQTLDGRKAAAICRFLPSNVLLIITAYAL